MPDPRKMQVNLTGFMDKHGAAAFVSELWKLLLSAQDTVGGVPAEVRNELMGVDIADEVVYRCEKGRVGKGSEGRTAGPARCQTGHWETRQGSVRWEKGE